MTGADDAAVLADVALRLGVLGRPIYVSLGVDDDLVEALGELAGAVVTETVYVKRDESHVIRAVRVRVGDVEMKAQCCGRPATSVEVEAAGGWREHVDVDYRFGTLYRRTQ